MSTLIDLVNLPGVIPTPLRLVSGAILDHNGHLHWPIGTTQELPGAPRIVDLADRVARHAIVLCLQEYFVTEIGVNASLEDDVWSSNEQATYTAIYLFDSDVLTFITPPMRWEAAIAHIIQQRLWAPDAPIIIGRDFKLTAEDIGNGGRYHYHYSDHGDAS